MPSNDHEPSGTQESIEGAVTRWVVVAEDTVYGLWTVESEAERYADHLRPQVYAVVTPLASPVEQLLDELGS